MTKPEAMDFALRITDCVEQWKGDRAVEIVNSLVARTARRCAEIARNEAKE